MKRIIAMILSFAVMVPSVACAGTYTTTSEPKAKQFVYKDIKNHSAKTIIYLKDRKKIKVTGKMLENLLNGGRLLDGNNGTKYMGDFYTYSSYKTWSADIANSTRKINGYWKRRIRATHKYNRSKSQDNKLFAFVQSKSKSLKLSSKNSYDKVKTIHDYIVKNVVYGGGNDAYAAAFNHKSKCKGQSTLFYLFCRYNGIACRVVTSSNHAWNEVKLNGVWYHLDATNDRGRNYLFFLRSYKNFKKLVNNNTFDLEKRFKTKSWNKAHKPATSDHKQGIIERVKFWW